MLSRRDSTAAPNLARAVTAAADIEMNIVNCVYICVYMYRCTCKIHNSSIVYCVCVCVCVCVFVYVCIYYKVYSGTNKNT